MDPSELFSRCLAQATAVVKQVRADQMANATPDTEWNVRDLTNHILYELSWVPEMLAGKTVAEVGDKYDGDLVGESDIDLSTHWQAAADRAEAAVADVDPDETVHTSYDDISVEAYLREIARDLLIHAWDLGVSIGMPVRFDAGLAEEIYRLTLPQQAALAKGGLFAPALQVNNNADWQTRLLALTGRRADWRPRL